MKKAKRFAALALIILIAAGLIGVTEDLAVRPAALASFLPRSKRAPWLK
mgnify:CR=1 FL=1